MPTYATPEPITVDLELVVGDLRITATDRSDTVVEVRPSDPAKPGDVTAAEQTRVEFSDGRLLVKAPKNWRRYTPWGEGDSIDVEIALPTGSRLEGEAAVVALRSTGRVDGIRYRTGVGDIHLDETGPIQVRTGAGDVTVERATGRAEITTGSGALHVGDVDGPAVVKNSNGDTWIGDVAGEFRANVANGTIAVDRPRAAVFAKSGNGDIRLDAVERGEIVAETGFGKVDIGVADGVAAWLELKTSFGSVHNGLDAADGPEAGQDAVEIRARTGYGDIAIHRAGSSGS